MKAECVSPAIPCSFHSLNVSLDIPRSEARFYGATRNGKPVARILSALGQYKEQP